VTGVKILNNQYYPVALHGYLRALTEHILQYFAVHSPNHNSNNSEVPNSASVSKEKLLILNSFQLDMFYELCKKSQG